MERDKGGETGGGGEEEWDGENMNGERRGTDPHSLSLSLSLQLSPPLSPHPPFFVSPSPLYSPSVFSRMTTMSRPLHREGTPGVLKPCTRLTCRSRALRRATLRDCVDVLEAVSGVKSVPLKQAPLRRMEARTAGSISRAGDPSGHVPETPGNRSHRIGAPSAATTSSTAPATSGPMPSPGMRVTVRSPAAPTSGT